MSFGNSGSKWRPQASAPKENKEQTNILAAKLGNGKC